MSVDVRADAALLQEQVVAFVRAFGLHRPSETPCGKPVPVSEAHALAELARDDGLTQRDLAARLRLEKSTVSRLAGQLVSRGWAERGPHPTDGRAVLVRLTESGERIAAEIEEARRRRFASLLDRIPEDAREDVLRVLGTLREALDDDA
ncbi:MAG TPA: MarR family transcriptional regulator [Gaiellaceae bacterium]|nr:MarR family transcriptional regulator [Gaiellaceae bacterium]